MMQLVAFLVLFSPLMGALVTADILQVTASESPEPGLAGNRSLTEKHSTPGSSTTSSTSPRMHNGLHHENPTQKFDVKNYFRTNTTRLGSNNTTDPFGYKRYSPTSGEQQQQQQTINNTRQQLFKATFVTPQTPTSTFSLGFGTGSHRSPTHPSRITAAASTNIRTTKVMLPPESLFLFGSGNLKTTTTTSTTPSTMPNMMEGCAGSGAMLGALQPLILFVTVIVTFQMGN